MDYLRETKEEWKEEAAKFDGDKRLFWAGRMSLSILNLERASLSNLSYAIGLCSFAKDMYDSEIMKDKIRK